MLYPSSRSAYSDDRAGRHHRTSTQGERAMADGRHRRRRSVAQHRPVPAPQRPRPLGIVDSDTGIEHLMTRRVRGPGAARESLRRAVWCAGAGREPDHPRRSRGAARCARPAPRDRRPDRRSSLASHRNSGPRPVSTRAARPTYDRWRDIEGTHIPDRCRVEQVEVDRGYGALRCRLRKRGEVVGRSRSNRLYVHFEGESSPTSVRPHLLRVIEAGDDDR